MTGVATEVVILIHGLWLAGWAMGLQQRRLDRAGFRAIAFSYPSIADDLDTNARRLAEFVAAQPEPTVHLVGHSLGGLLALHMLEIAPDPRVRRVVLAGSPWRGSTIARTVHDWPGGETAVGRSLAQWYAAPRPDLGQRYEIGVIAGTVPFGAGTLVARLQRPHDGTVTVEETRLPTMADHLLLPVTHTSMLTSTAVARAVVQFLRQGRFGAP